MILEFHEEGEEVISMIRRDSEGMPDVGDFVSYSRPLRVMQVTERLMCYVCRNKELLVQLQVEDAIEHD